MSTYVLARLLPEAADRFATMVASLDDTEEDRDRRRFVLAAVHDFLQACPPIVFTEAVGGADLRRLPPWIQNYVAAMVEVAAQAKAVPPPARVRSIPPLETPHFATQLKSLRPHLLRASPVPFKRRNLFVDATVGDRV